MSLSCVLYHNMCNGFMHCICVCVRNWDEISMTYLILKCQDLDWKVIKCACSQVGQYDSIAKFLLVDTFLLLHVIYGFHHRSYPLSVSGLGLGKENIIKCDEVCNGILWNHFLIEFTGQLRYYDINRYCDTKLHIPCSGSSRIEL